MPFYKKRKGKVPKKPHKIAFFEIAIRAISRDIF